VDMRHIVLFCIIEKYSDKNAIEHWNCRHYNDFSCYAQLELHVRNDAIVCIKMKPDTENDMPSPQFF
jgi:hypothetical protein